MNKVFIHMAGHVCYAGGLTMHMGSYLQISYLTVTLTSGFVHFWYAMTLTASDIYILYQQQQ